MEKILYNINTLTSERSFHATKYECKTLPNNNVEEIETLLKIGWNVSKKLKYSTKYTLQKNINTIFIDRVWMLTYKVGFHLLNKISPIFFCKDGTTIDFDIIASDNDTILAIKCFTTFNKKTIIDSKNRIQGHLAFLIRQLRFETNAESKIKFIFAFSCDINKDEMIPIVSGTEIYLLDEIEIKYYEELAQHIKSASKYQLLGNIFEGQRISSIDSIIPAIEGKMGGYTYYSFSIEPAKLLKFSYVLHRNEVHRNNMPSYQRLIKKSRLDEIFNFIENEGFFPNSIVININSSNDLKFEYKSVKEANQLSRIGMLYLPQMYKSIFIIDGQHRLYGYSDSKYATTNTIPVVAFVNLKKSDQIRLFMEINENQKPVTKNLRNTLNADLLWDSDSPIDQNEALCIKIGIQLGIDITSSLKDKIIIGEVNDSAIKCITLDTIRLELLNSRMISQFDKNFKMKTKGIFDTDDIETTYQVIFNYINSCFNYISVGLDEDWKLGKSGSLTINVGVSAMIKIFDDILQEVFKQSPDLFNKRMYSQVFEKSKYYLDIIIEYYESLNQKMRIELKTSYGGGGKVKYWRHLQQALKNKVPTFSPIGLDEYFANNNIQNNKIAYEIINKIESYIKKDMKERLRVKFGNTWITLGLPKQVFDSINKLALDRTYEKRNENLVFEPWDCTNFINLKEIMIYQSNWSDLFAQRYSKSPKDGKRNKESLVSWMNKLNDIRNDISHNRNVSFDNLQYLQETSQWLLGESYE